MRYFSSASDCYFDYGADSLTYYIELDGNVIYTGVAVKSPSKDYLSINVGKRIRDYLYIHMPDFSDYDGVVIPHPEALLVFNLYSNDGTLLEQYTMKFDEEKEWNGEYGALAKPINGRADSRQKIFYGYASQIGGDIDIVTSGGTDYYFRFTTPNGQYISSADTSYTVTWETNYPYIIYEYSGVTQSTTNMGATVTFPALEDSASTVLHTIEAYSPSGVFLGSLTWMQGTYALGYDYLTFVILSGGTIELTKFNSFATWNFSYSRDSGETWVSVPGYAGDASTPAFRINVTEGERVLFKGYHAFEGKFVNSTAVFDLEGNIMSMYWGDDFRGKTSPKYTNDDKLMYLFAGTKVVRADRLIIGLRSRSYSPETHTGGLFEGLFSGCTMLVSAPRELYYYDNNTQPSNFKYMFYGCTSLVDAPSSIEFKAIGSIGTSTFESMFEGCTSLVTAPTISVTPRNSAPYTFCRTFYGCSSLKNVASEYSAELSPSTPSGNSTGAYLFFGMFANCTSLETAPNLPAEVVGKGWYSGMFAGCTSLVNAPVISATTILDEGESDTPRHPNYDGTVIIGDYRFYKIKGAFKQMFQNCTSLVTPPVFLATTDFTDSYEETFKGCTSLASLVSSTGITGCRMYENCVSLTGVTIAPGGIFAIEEFKGCTSITGVTYTGLGEGMFLGCTSLTRVSQFAYSSGVGMCGARYMFSGCTSLSSVPNELSPTSLGERCYYGMFRGCTSLNSAPSLPASILKPYSYAYMFDGCTNLSSIRCLATEKKVDDAPTFQWIRGVTNHSGTFTKKSGVSWYTTGSGSYYDGVPVGWTITEVQ